MKKRLIAVLVVMSFMSSLTAEYASGRTQNAQCLAPASSMVLSKKGGLARRELIAALVGASAAAAVATSTNREISPLPQPFVPSTPLEKLKAIWENREAFESLFSLIFAPVLALTAMATFLYHLISQKLNRRTFTLGSLAGGLLAATGCVSTEPDRASQWQPYQKKIKHPNQLNYSLGQYLDLMLDYDLELKRVFLDYIMIDVVNRLKDDASKDVVFRGSLAAVMEGLNVAPAGAITMYNDTPASFFPGVLYTDYATHDRTDASGNKTQAVDNLTFASRLNGTPAILPGKNPAPMIDLPILGNDSIPDPDKDWDRMANAVRRKFKALLANKISDAILSYNNLVELNQDLGWLEELRQNYQNQNLPAKVDEVERSIADTKYKIRIAETDFIFRKIGFPEEDLPDWKTVSVNISRRFKLEFTETGMPKFYPEDVRNRILENSVTNYELSSALGVMDEAIGAAKKTAATPKINFVAGIEPNSDITTTILGFRYEVKPWRQRGDEANIMQLRIGRIQKQIDILSLKKKMAADTRDLGANRDEYLRRIRKHKTDYDAAVTAAGNTAGKGAAQQLADQAALLEAKRAYLASLRDFNQFETTRFVLEGFIVTDNQVSDVLDLMKTIHYQKYIHQDEIYFHDFFGRALKSILLPLAAALGFAVASSPSTATAQEGRPRTDVPALRRMASPFSVLSNEPLINSSL